MWLRSGPVEKVLCVACPGMVEAVDNMKMQKSCDFVPDAFRQGPLTRPE
jgi:hypothetical protein